MKTRHGWVVLMGLAAVGAQAEPAPRLELSGGAVWTGSQPLGTSVAWLNSSAGGPRRALFEATSRRQEALGWQAGLSLRVIGPLRLEAGLASMRPELATSILRDGEGAPDQALGGAFLEQRYEGSLRADLSGLSLGQGRLTPSLFAGAGLQRQAGRDATSYHAGLGLRLALLQRPGGALRALGLRLDGRSQWRSGGLELEGAARNGWVAQASLFLGR